MRLWVCHSPPLGLSALQGLLAFMSLKQFPEDAYRRQQAKWLVDFLGERFALGCPLVFFLFEFNPSAYRVESRLPILSSPPPLLFSQLRDLNFLEPESTKEAFRAPLSESRSHPFLFSVKIAPVAFEVGLPLPWPHCSCLMMKPLIKLIFLLKGKQKVGGDGSLLDFASVPITASYMVTLTSVAQAHPFMAWKTEAHMGMALPKIPG